MGEESDGARTRYSGAGHVSEDDRKSNSPVRPQHSTMEMNQRTEVGPQELECIEEQKTDEQDKDEENERPQRGERQDEEEVQDQEGDEGRAPKAARDPKQPTKVEVEEHNLTHVPFRTWCKFCIWGKACDRQHRRREDEGEAENSVVRIHLDYFYITKENEKRGQNPMLVVVDSRKKNVMGIATGSTGEVPWVAKKIADEIEAWGYGSTSIVLFSDNEPAILSLKRAVMARRDKETILMETIEGDSQANGVAEWAVRMLEGQIRTMKAALEDKLGNNIDKEHPLWQ